MFALVGCSSHQQAILERSDDLSSRPNWANISDSYYEKDGKIFFVGFIEVDGSSSKSAALNMSDEKALSEPMRALVDQFLDQNQVGEQLRKDEQFGRRIISATRGYRPPVVGLKIGHRYWERGPNDVRAFSQAEMSLADYEDAKRAYLAHLRGDPEVKKILDEVGAKQIEKILSKQ